MQVDQLELQATLDLLKRFLAISYQPKAVMSSRLVKEAGQRLAQMAGLQWHDCKTCLNYRTFKCQPGSMLISRTCKQCLASTEDLQYLPLWTPVQTDGKDQS